MNRWTLAVIVVGLAVAVLAGQRSSVWAQPVASIALPPPRGPVQLYPGCNNIALSFPDGTTSQTVVGAVTPAGVVEAMWRHNAAQNRFEGFSPAAPQASDLLTVNLWDAVWLCVGGIAPPAGPPPTAPTATQVPAPPTGPTPIILSSDLQFHVHTSRFRLDWTATLREVFGTEGRFSAIVMAKSGLPVCVVEGVEGVGVKSGSQECDKGLLLKDERDFFLEMLIAGVSSWQVTITPLAD